MKNSWTAIACKAQDLCANLKSESLDRLGARISPRTDSCWKTTFKKALILAWRRCLHTIPGDFPDHCSEVEAVLQSGELLVMNGSLIELDGEHIMKPVEYGASLRVCRNHAGLRRICVITNPPRQLLEKIRIQSHARVARTRRNRQCSFNSGGSGSFVSSPGTRDDQPSRRPMNCKNERRKAQLPPRRLFAKTGAEKCVDPPGERPRGHRGCIPVQHGREGRMSPEDSFKATELSFPRSKGIVREAKRSDVVTLYQGGEYHLYRQRPPTSASSSPPKSRSRSSAATRTTSSIRATTSTSACFVFTRTTSPPNWSIT